MWIPDGARCCPDHIHDRRFTTQAIDTIKPLSVRYQEWNSSDVETMLGKFRILYQDKKGLNFDDPNGLSDATYLALTSCSRADFDHLVKVVSVSSLRNSSNRSIRTAIGIYLCKLRLGLSNNLLSIMFDLPSKRAVSSIINSARQALMASFVPQNLGFGHVTRQEIINLRTTPVARDLMCDGGQDRAVLVIDGTYIYIQVCMYEEKNDDRP
jgi:hypothetical protein